MMAKKLVGGLSTNMEYLDIVNDKDEVVGRAPHADIYAKRLPHRIVHVLVSDSSGRMFLQLRSAKESFCPLHWGTAVGGHVQSGETYEAAALRESQEELGLSFPVSFVNKYFYTDGTHRKFLAVFRAELDNSHNFQGGEAERVEFFSITEIQQMIGRGEKFMPELLFLISNLL